jgi:hypothetical protein
MSVTSTHMVPVPRGPVVAQRDDGGLAKAMGAVVSGQLPPLPPAVAGAFVTGVLLAVGVAGSAALAIFTPVVAVLLIGPGSSHAHDGRLDWLVPPILRLIEYVFVASVGLACEVPAPVVFALLGAVLFHHYDLVQRVRQRVYPPSWLATAGLGWEGRMLLVALAALAGAVTVWFVLFAAYLWGLFLWESVTCWLATGEPAAGTGPAGAEE